MHDKPDDYEMKELAGLFACYAHTILLYQAEAPFSMVAEEEENSVDMEVDDSGNDDEEEEEKDAAVTNNVCSYGLYCTSWYSTMQQEVPLMLGATLCEKRHRATNMARHGLGMAKILSEVFDIFTRMTQCRIESAVPDTEDVARLFVIYGREDPTMRVDNGTWWLRVWGLFFSSFGVCLCSVTSSYRLFFPLIVFPFHVSLHVLLCFVRKKYCCKDD